MENGMISGAKTEQLQPFGGMRKHFSAHCSLEQRPSGTFDDHLAKVEAVYWRNQLDSAPLGLRRLAEKIYALSGIESMQRVDRRKFVCDIGCLSQSPR